MNRRYFLALGTLALPGCAALRAVGQIDQIGPARQALIDYLPPNYLLTIKSDLQYLDDSYNEIKKVINRDPDVSFLDLLTLALGAPAEFRLIGEAYGRIYDAVTDYRDQSKETIPTTLIVFDAGMRPAYKSLKTALQANDKAVKAVKFANLLRPIVIAI